MLAHLRGLSALVVTDHCSGRCSYFSNVNILKTLSAIVYPLPIPVILGCELNTPYGDFVLFGKKAIKNWYQYRDYLSSVGPESYWLSFSKLVLHKSRTSIQKQDDDEPLVVNLIPLPYAMFLPHPGRVRNEIERWPDIVWELLDGYEYMNWMENYHNTHPEVVAFLESKIKSPLRLNNSDAHDSEVGEMNRNVFNVSDKFALTEGNLIHLFKMRGKNV
jgi:hypothetical protein